MPSNSPAVAPIRARVPTDRRAIERAPESAVTNDASRTILIVSYHFPPDVRVGAVRPAKFAKYLSRFGWRPFVLTIKTGHLPAQEEARMQDVWSIPIIRTVVWPTALDVLLRVRNAISRLLRPPSGRSPQADPGGRPPVEYRDPVEGRSRLRRLGHFLFEFPDVEVGWILPAVWHGYRLIKKERIRVLMVTSPPRSSVFIGVILSWLTGVRLITDLRDPWLPRDGGPGDRQLDGSDRLRAWLERRVIACSDQVITTTNLYTSCLQQCYGAAVPEKFHTITNGYDAEDFATLSRSGPNERFTLSYLGTFYWTRTPRSLLQALSELVADGALPRELLQVNFIGTVSDASGESVADLVRANGLEGCVAMRGVIPYQQSLQEMHRADALLLLAPDAQYYGIPAKTFEYLGTGKPILCLGNTGATADLIGRSPTGIVVNPHDVPAIKQAIERLFTAWRSGSGTVPALDTSSFERSQLTRDLITLLARVS